LAETNRIHAYTGTTNHKRTERLYRLEKLSLRRRKRRRKLRGVCVVFAATKRVNERWSMDFVSDSLASGQGSDGAASDFGESSCYSEGEI
jgi:hypothetical protein